jgi:hypothetical protein
MIYNRYKEKKMSNDYDSRLLDGKKLIKKILKLQRFSSNKENGLLKLDYTGQVVFMNDVINIIEKEMNKE